MELKKDDAVKLVEQLQQAHRISVAFYRRFLPLLDEIAAKFECQFRYWKPLLTDMPCRSSTRPSNKWAWDFIPLFASNHLYWRVNGGGAQPEDAGISFFLYIDDGFTSESRKKHNVVGEPDAVTLPIGRAVLQAYIFRPTRKSKKTYEELWNQIEDDPILGETEMKALNDDIQGISFEWPMAEVISDKQIVIDTLKPYMD